MHRRDVVATLLFAGSSGCLRLQDGESDSATDGGTTTPAPTNERTASTPADEATAPDAGDDDTGTVELELSRQWELDAFADAVLSVSTEDGAFYLGSYSREQRDSVHKVTADGEIDWSTADVPATHTVYKSSTAVSQDQFIIGCQGESALTLNPSANPDDLGGVVRAYDRQTGTNTWDYRTDNSVGVADVATDAETGYVAVGNLTDDGVSPTILALDTRTGDLLWTQPEYPRDDSNPYVHSLTPATDRVFASTRNGVVSLDPRTGDVTGHRQNPNQGSVVSDGDVIYTVHYPSVAAVDPDSLDPLWETDIVSGVELPAMVDGGVLFFATREGHVYALDGDTGEIEWRERTVARPSYVSLSRNHVWVSDTEGLVYAFSRSDGSTAFESDAHAEEGAALESVNPISATSDTVFIGGTSRSLYTIS